MTEYLNDVVLGEVSPVATLHMSEAEKAERTLTMTVARQTVFGASFDPVPFLVWSEAYHYGDGHPVVIITEDGEYIGSTYEGGVILR